MFSALRQGSVVYILEKGENPVLKVGQVVSITQPNYSSNFLMNGSTIDINVKVNNQNMDFKNVPSSQSIANYNNAVITETKELMSNEVDNMLQSSRSIVDSVTYHNNIITSCFLLIQTGIVSRREVTLSFFSFLSLFPQEFVSAHQLGPIKLCR